MTEPHAPWAGMTSRPPDRRSLAGPVRSPLQRHAAGLARAGWGLSCLLELARSTPCATLDCLREDLACCEPRHQEPETTALRAAITYTEKFRMRRRRNGQAKKVGGEITHGIR